MFMQVTLMKFRGPHKYSKIGLSLLERRKRKKGSVRRQRGGEIGRGRHDQGILHIYEIVKEYILKNCRNKKITTHL